VGQVVRVFGHYAGAITVSINLEGLHEVIGSPNGSVPLDLWVYRDGGTVYHRPNVPSGPFTTGDFLVLPNQPVALTLRLTGLVRCHLSSAQFSGGVSFPTGASAASGLNAASSVLNVFNVPAGVTVNSVQANIVDNVWQPVPVRTEETTWGQVKSLYR
jgi:hypothetical protein